MAVSHRVHIRKEVLVTWVSLVDTLLDKVADNESSHHDNGDGSIMAMKLSVHGSLLILSAYLIRLVYEAGGADDPLALLFQSIRCSDNSAWTMSVRTQWSFNMQKEHRNGMVTRDCRVNETRAPVESRILNHSKTMWRKRGLTTNAFRCFGADSTPTVAFRDRRCADELPPENQRVSRRLLVVTIGPTEANDQQLISGVKSTLRTRVELHPGKDDRGVAKVPVSPRDSRIA
ncbi:hypothetical protein EDD16DRAFT_1729907 [Pisolithus croceorrhizus]|nr:hypothetical protein EDD16DRAFT_1729907 [Pisolithus croceorrhizus]